MHDFRDEHRKPQRRAKPKVVFANAINLQGLYSSTPVKCTIPRKYADGKWWSADGEFDVVQLGTYQEMEGVTVYAAIEQSRVEAWTEGAKAVLALLHRLAESGTE